MESKSNENSRGRDLNGIMKWDGYDKYHLSASALEWRGLVAILYYSYYKYQRFAGIYIIDKWLDVFCRFI